jgi:hypothetical protein
MTIRQYLRCRSDRYATRTFIFLLLAGALVTAGPRDFIIRFVFAVVIGAIVAAAFWSLFKIPCPRCNMAMGSAGFWVAVGRTNAPAAHCPHCRVGFDEPMNDPSPSPS